MSLNWQQSPNSIHTKSQASTEYSVSDDVNLCIAKATSQLDESIKDNSQFFLVEFDKQTCTLSITVTDQSKTDDCTPTVVCHFKALEKLLNADNEIEWLETIQFAASNYLTTDADFMRYSLIAMFTCETRDYCQIL